MTKSQFLQHVTMLCGANFSCSRVLHFVSKTMNSPFLTFLFPLWLSPCKVVCQGQISPWPCCMRSCQCSDHSFLSWADFPWLGRVKPIPEVGTSAWLHCLFLFPMTLQLHSPILPRAFSHFREQSIFQASSREAWWSIEKKLDQEIRNLSARLSPNTA